MPMLILINLDSATERRHHMSAQLAAHALPFERIGFDGRAQPPEAIAAWSRERFGNLAFDTEALSGAEIGCWLSHVLAWDRLRRDRTLAACTVIEDDVLLAAEFAATMTALADPAPYDVVFLGTSSRNISARRCTPIGRCWIHAPVGTVFNTWGYVIARAFVERFFATTELHLRMPIDHFLGGNARRAVPRTGVLRPPVVTEHQDLGARSQIEPHTHRIDRWKVIERARRRLLESRMSKLYYSLYRLL
jgi:glycosyl transferase family 25